MSIDGPRCLARIGIFEHWVYVSLNGNHLQSTFCIHNFMRGVAWPFRVVDTEDAKCVSSPLRLTLLIPALLRRDMFKWQSIDQHGRNRREPSLIFHTYSGAVANPEILALSNVQHPWIWTVTP
jgi:hypothetical protein